MKSFFILASAMVVLFLAAPDKIDAQEKKPITNADIVAMVKAELPESNIVKAIQQSITNFDTSPLGLIELQKQGVSSKIIDAMQQAAAPTSPAQPQTNNPLSNQQPPSNVGMGVVIFVDAAGRTEMKYSPQDLNIGIGVMDVINPFGSSKIKAVFKGNHARLRTTTTAPAFEASLANNSYPTDQIGLVRLTQKKDKREIETGKIKMASGSSGFNKKDVVPITFEEIKEQQTSGSFYKRYSIKTVNPLPPGEYALAVSGSYYDFGVDPVK